MVSKLSTLITKHANPDTAGRVPSSGQLQYSELAINTTDRKIYTKDASGAVVQVTAPPGRYPGQALVFESFFGSNLQGVTVNEDGRVWFKHSQERVDDYATVLISRDVEANAPGNNVPGTAAALRIDCNVKKSGLQMFQWPLTVVMTIDAADGGASPTSENVAIFGGVNKKTEAGVWGANIGVTDEIANTTTASIGVEITHAARGLDPNNQRFALLIACGSNPYNTDGNNEITYGITFSAPPARCKLKAMINFDAAAYTALNFTTMKPDRGQSVMKIAPGYKIEWAASLMDTVQANFTYESGQFKFNGASTFSSAAGGAASALPSAPKQYVEMNFNGATLRFPGY